MQTWPQNLRPTVELMLAMPQPAWICWGPDLRLLYNDQYVTILGSKHPDALGRPWAEIWPEIPDALWPVPGSVRDRAPQQFVNAQCPLTGRGERLSPGRFTTTWTPLRDDGRIAGLFGVAMETTERVLADGESEETHRTGFEVELRERTAELNRSGDLLQAMMDSSMDMIQVFEAVRDETGEIVDFRWILNNRTSEEIYGEVVGKSLLQNNPGVVEEGIFDTLKRVVETGEPDRSERHYVHEQFNGWFYQSTVKLGEAVATTTTDITRVKEAEQEILRLERFFSSVSHELQTPLTAVRAGLGLLDTAIGETLGPAERELLRASRRNAERLRLKINQLLAANQMIAGGPEVERLVVNLRWLVEGAVEAVRPLLQEKEQTVDIDIPDRLEVEGDRRLLELVVSNLLSNANRHTPAGTHIAVSGWFVGDHVRLAVHDTGTGIPPDQLEAIFHRFHRASGSTREGIGLGLAITRDAVEAQGGRVWAESVVGQGTTFFVSLPRARSTGVP